MISWDNLHRVQRQRPVKVRYTASRRLMAFLCLLTLMAQLALIVAHSWEMPVEAVALSVTRAFHALPTGPGDAMALSQGATASRRWLHDPLLCPVCQMLSQAKNGIAPHGPGVVLLQTSFALLLGSAFHRSSLDLAVSAPRAPPYFL